MLRPHAAPKLMCAHRGLVFQLFAQITVGRDISERVIRIELTSSAWRADVLTVVLYPLMLEPPDRIELSSRRYECLIITVILRRHRCMCEARTHNSQLLSLRDSRSTDTVSTLGKHTFRAEDRSRTCNPLITSQVLYH